MGWSATNRDGNPDRFRDAISVLPHIAVPEAEDLPAQPLKKGRAFGVVSHRVDMLTAVEFDRDLQAATGEIENVPTDRQLTGEVRFDVSDVRPQRALFRGRGAA